MTIILKNGATCEVTQEIAEIIAKKLTQDVPQKQIFKNAEKNNEVCFVIDLGEIACMIL